MKNQIFSAKKAARETVKQQLELEIPLVVNAIKKAKEEGKVAFIYDKSLSFPTVHMLKKSRI